MILYQNSNTVHFLFLLHLSYTFFRAPEAMLTLKFEDETANQLSPCTKIISSYVVFRTKYNSIYFLSTLIQKFPSCATKFSLPNTVEHTITIDRPDTQSRMLDHRQLGMTGHRGACTRFSWKIQESERTTKEYCYMYLHHTYATA